jgi:hypothetical protein
VSLDGPLSEPGGIVKGVMSSAGISRAHAAAEAALPVGVFRDKGLKEAIEIFLAAGHRKQTNKEISVGLKKGGIATTSANFEATVATALYRMKEEGTVLRFPDGWDLAASYPDNLKARLEKDAKPRAAKKTKRTRRRRAQKAESTTPTTIRIRPRPRSTTASEDLKVAG